MTPTLLPAKDPGAASGHPSTDGGDTVRDILTEAYRSSAAPPVAVHIRPELRHRVGPASDLARTSALPFLVDAALPTAPGYEVHRAVPEVAPSAEASTR